MPTRKHVFGIFDFQVKYRGVCFAKSASATLISNSSLVLLDAHPTTHYGQGEYINPFLPKE
jgi:hypothetical protein